MAEAKTFREVYPSPPGADFNMVVYIVPPDIADTARRLCTDIGIGNDYASPNDVAMGLTEERRRCHDIIEKAIRDGSIDPKVSAWLLEQIATGETA